MKVLLYNLIEDHCSLASCNSTKMLCVCVCVFFFLKFCDMPAEERLFSLSLKQL
jgi:hypothetical protein